MSSRLRSAGKVAGAATVVVPTVRKLMQDVEDLEVTRYLPVSAQHLRQTRTRSLIAGSIIGVAAGFVAGVLLSQRVRDRMKIDEFAEEARERVTGTAHEFQQKATETVHEAREKVEAGMEDVREKVEGTMQTAQEKVQSGMQTVQEKTEAGMQTVQEKTEAGMQTAEEKTQTGMESAESKVTGITGKAGDQPQRPPSGTTTTWNAGTVVDYVRGVHYPAGKRDVRSVAAAHGAPRDLLERIDELPEQTFRHADDITIALGVGTYQPTGETRREERGAA